MRTTTVLLLPLLAATPLAETAEVHFAAIIDDFDAVSAVEFRVENLPVDACAIEQHWNTPLVLGALDSGISLAFAPHLEGPVAYLGRVDFTTHAEVGGNWIMEILPSLDGGNLVVVDGNYDSHGAEGYLHIFNCIETEWPHCNCYRIVGPPLPVAPIIGMFADYGTWEVCHQDLPFTPTSVPEEQDLIDAGEWSRLKSLYRSR